MPSPNYGTPVRGLTYGPAVGEHGTAQTVGAYDNRLGPRDVALSPNLLSQYPMGRSIMIRDASGNPIGNYNVADSSWYEPGRPTSNTVEFRDQPRSGQFFIGDDLSNLPPVAASSPYSPGSWIENALRSGAYFPDLSNAPPVSVSPPAGMLPSGEQAPPSIIGQWLPFSPAREARAEPRWSSAYPGGRFGMLSGAAAEHPSLAGEWQSISNIPGGASTPLGGGKYNWLL